MLKETGRESVRKIFNRYEQEPSHAEQVNKIALIIFDKTKGLIHNMSDNERELLEAGALLHDIGYYISAKGHNKNSYKLITENTLPGFSGQETEIIANIARYHRGKPPKDKHSCYAFLSQHDKHLVNRLGAFVRLADAFDRSHRNVINDLDFVFDSFLKTLIIVLKLNAPDCFFEILKAKDKKDLFEKEFGLNIKFTKEIKQ